MINEKITVALDSRSYEIVVGSGLIADAGQLVAPLVKHPPVIIVTDTNVAAIHADALQNSLNEAEIASEIITLDSGEQTKEFSVFESLLSSILDIAPERASTIIALGGGVIGDVAGFAASVILRGIDIIQIPTTLLSQVDSSVGGKTGINTPHGKNLIGTFYQPRLVIADTTTLDTLPRRELLAGYAEVVKYGLLGFPEFFEWLEQNGTAVLNGDKDALCHAILTSCKAKVEIVANDERESGQRALLNFGHTFAHSLEAETEYGRQLLHGEAVAIGMIMAFDLSVQLGLCAADDASRVRAHYQSVGLPVDLGAINVGGWSVPALICHMKQDKKVRDGRVTFILTRGIGDTFIAKDVSLNDVEALLENAISA